MQRILYYAESVTHIHARPSRRGKTVRLPFAFTHCPTEESREGVTIRLQLLDVSDFGCHGTSGSMLAPASSASPGNSDFL